MSKHLLRNDQVCQNCGDQVEKRFCSNCGQENTETRQSFGHLLRHFIEDLTHYDTAFWLTIRYLLFRPAFLTKEYLSGKRARFVPPVRLYIFVSFVTFLLPYLLPDVNSDSPAHITSEQTRDTGLKNRQMKFTFNGNDDLLIQVPTTYTSLTQMDSTEATLPEAQRMDFVDRWYAKKYIHLQKYSPRELGEKFQDSFGHNFPKALFIYMPLFALMLWLFHGKKRWLYFDHAIFTLHYFSFILLVFNVMTLSDQFIFFNDTGTAIQLLLLALVILAIFIYFLMAHKRMYGEKVLVSFIKSLFVYAANLTLLAGVLFLLLLISVFNIH